MKLISTRANLRLSSDIASELCTSLVKAKFLDFLNEEIKITIEENLEDEDVFILHSTSISINKFLIELFLLIDAARSMKPKTISIIFPYLNYSRQDKGEAGESIAMRYIASTLEAFQVDKVLTIDIHSSNAASFFGKNFENIEVTNLFAEHIKKQKTDIKQTIIVSPDQGGEYRAIKLSKKLNITHATIEKKREGVKRVKALNVNADVTDKICYIVDDIINTANTLAEAAKLLDNSGAKEIHAYATHAILSKNALEKIHSSPIKSLTLTNSTNIELEKHNKNISIIDIKSLIAGKIKSLEKQK